MHGTVRINLPVFQLWAPEPGWILNTAITFNPSTRGDRQRALESMRTTLADRKANGQAFKHERIVQATAFVSTPNGSMVDAHRPQATVSVNANIGRSPTR